jgi:hypothetical protein
MRDERNSRDEPSAEERAIQIAERLRREREEDEARFRRMVEENRARIAEAGAPRDGAREGGGASPA